MFLERGVGENHFDWDTIREFCRRKFVAERNPVFPNMLSQDDRAFLLKLGALCVRGDIPEGMLDGALEAIRHHDKPIGNRAAYLTTVLQTSLQERGLNLGKLLAGVAIPAELLNAPTKQG